MLTLCGERITSRVATYIPVVDAYSLLVILFEQ